ncbi:MAG: DUF3347 domain-containing protein [Chitinophagaceae bacterium]
MKKVFIILGILFLLLAGYIWYSFKGGNKKPRGPKPVALAVSKHSPAFNQSVQSVIDAYYSLSEGFVNWDSPGINKSAGELKTALDNMKIEELRDDIMGIYETALDPLSNSKNATDNIITGSSLDEKRMAFNNLSENLRLLFIVVKYDQAKLYWQECPMAFGDNQPGYWLSETDAVRNPYMGISHPKYKDGMLKCGGPRDTINFMAVDTLNK